MRHPLSVPGGVLRFVIPAQAGIQGLHGAANAGAPDSRLRGNDEECA
jgi:hypothetical protein